MATAIVLMLVGVWLILQTVRGGLVKRILPPDKG
jgi:hypothetical protein